MSAQAGLYVHDGSTAQAVTSTAAKMTGFDTLMPYGSDAVDGNLSCVPALGSDQVAIKAGGRYKISFNASMKGSGAGVIQIHARTGTTELAHIAAELEVIAATANEVLCCSAEGLYVPTADCNISLYIECNNSINVTPVHASLLVERID